MQEAERIKELFNTLINSELYKFPIAGKVVVSKDQGVYIIFNSESCAAHVGNTVRGKEGLNQRLNNHLKNQSTFAQKFISPNNYSLRSEFRYQYIVVPSARDRALLQALAIGLLCPLHLGTHGDKIK